MVRIYLVRLRSIIQTTKLNIISSNYLLTSKEFGKGRIKDNVYVDERQYRKRQNLIAAYD